MHYDRVLAPLDGSSRAECVLSLTESLAQSHSAQLILAHVITRPEMIQRTPLSKDENELLDRLVERNQKEAEAYFVQLQERLTPSPTTRILEADNVEHALLKLAEDEDVDLVIMAAHGHSGDNRTRLWTTCRQLHRVLHVPVYIYQDLNVEEIEPLQAERMLQELEPLSEQRIKAKENAVE